jgi:hypothetical protein
MHMSVRVHAGLSAPLANAALQHRPPIISAATLASAPELDLEDSGSELDDYDAAYEAAWQETEPRPGHESEVSNSDKDEPEGNRAAAADGVAGAAAAAACDREEVEDGAGKTKLRQQDKV